MVTTDSRNVNKVKAWCDVQDKLAQGVDLEEEQRRALQLLLPDDAERAAINQFCQVS